MDRKMIEVCYDLAASQSALHRVRSRGAHAFRDAAARMIGGAVLAAGIGLLVTAEDGFGEVRLRLRVTDFEAAERAICRATAATPFAEYREILRYWEETGSA
jgi:hypothetical protein